MYKSKLIKIYSNFNRSEKTLFKKWVNSPVHNQHKDVLLLFEFIFSKRGHFTALSITKEKAYQFIYAASYNDLRLRHLMSLAVTILEKFVRFLIQDSNDFLQQKNLIQFYKDRELNKFSQQQIQKAKSVQQDQLIKDGPYYHNQYELETAIFEQDGEDERVRTTNLQAIFDAYSTAFVIEILRHACTALTYQNLNKKNQFNIPFLPQVLEQIELGTYQEIISVQFYYYSYKSLTEPNQASHYQQLKKLLFEHYQALQSSEIKNIHVIALNFCIKQLNNGDEKYVQEVFDLFKYGLDYNILIKNNVLSRFTYKNIITAALRLKEINWTSQFMEQYTPYLHTKYQKNYHHFASAKLLYTKGDYDKTMRLLLQVEYDDLFLNLDAKMILLKIYYEQGSTDALEALLHSFYIYLQRKEIMGYHQSNYKNNIKFTRKLLHLATYDKENLEKLRQQIEQASPLTEKFWLLQQIHKL
ncbi:MAG: hypothetical protein ACI976_002620 [Aureispira sp.]|jgi:hypothetical protein